MRVPSYAVVWARHPEERPLAGRLDLTEHGLRLRGGNGEAREKLVIPSTEILGLERGPQVRIGGSRAITVFRRSADELLIASVGGVSVLGEIFTALQQMLTG